MTARVIRKEHLFTEREANSRLRAFTKQVVKERLDQGVNPPNPRVKPVVADDWAKKRKEQFDGSIKYASVAKANRTALYVTLREVAEEFGVTTSTVFTWESGHYLGWDEKKLERYLKVVFRLARRVR